MKYLTALAILIISTSVGAPAYGQDCSCIGLTASASDDKSTVTVTVKNRCNRRIWFHTKSFYITANLDGTSTVYKLKTNEPEFILIKWMEAKEIKLKTEITNPKKKISLSYANTSYFQARNVFGHRTFICETSIKLD